MTEIQPAMDREISKWECLFERDYDWSDGIVLALIARIRAEQAKGDVVGWIVRVAGGYNFYTDSGVANAKAHFAKEVAQPVYTTPANNRAEAIGALADIVRAWEALPGGQQQPMRAVEKWLADEMAPSINRIRALLDKEGE